MNSPLQLLLCALIAPGALPVSRSYSAFVAHSPDTQAQCPKAADFVRVQSFCPLHKARLVPTDVSALGGHSFVVVLDEAAHQREAAARATKFPLARPAQGSGSCIDNPTCPTVVQFLCPECQRAEVAWHAKQ